MLWTDPYGPVSSVPMITEHEGTETATKTLALAFLAAGFVAYMAASPLLVAVGPILEALR